MSEMMRVHDDEVIVKVDDFERLKKVEALTMELVPQVWNIVQPAWQVVMGHARSLGYEVPESTPAVREIRVAHADRCSPIVIRIEKELPDHSGEGCAEVLRTTYASDAEALADALWTSLPGGTIDRLTERMLFRGASLLRVAYRHDARSAEELT
jgi:hypothetical protein